MKPVVIQSRHYGTGEATTCDARIPSQLPASTSWEAESHGSSNWVPASPVAHPEGVLAPGFSLAHPRCCRHLESPVTAFQVDEKMNR